MKLNYTKDHLIAGQGTQINNKISLKAKIKYHMNLIEIENLA